jgi:hypothetical protein
MSTVRRKNIRPFADFSSKMAIFKGSEKYLNDENSSIFFSVPAYINRERFLVWFW